MTDHPVLVTGGTGFLAAHTIAALLRAGHEVRTTVRSASRAAAVRAQVGTALGQDRPAGIDVVAADLTRDDGWEQALAGCRHVLHLASPFPASPPEDENELIAPARDGALRVLRAAAAAGTQRVVLTSSFAAVGYGTEPAARRYTEADWTDVEAPGTRAYVKSKTVAERAAWSFARTAAELELAVVNPVAIFGPVLGTQLSASIEIVQRLLSGRLPGVPRLAFGVVDVRDVADLHVRCMLDPAAAGERFLAVSGDFLTMGQFAGMLRAGLLRAGLDDAASRVPTRQIPDLAIRLAGRFSRELADFVPELGVLRQADGSKATRMLGWQPRPREHTLLDTARSLQEYGLV